VALIITMAACGGGSTPPPCTGASCPPTSSSDFLFVPDNSQVAIFQVDAASAAVTNTPTPVTGPPQAGGVVLSSTNFLFVSDYINNAVDVFSVNTTSGALTAVSGSPFTLGGGQGAEGVAVDPAGKFLYVTQHNDNLVFGFAIGSNGALTAVPGGAFATSTTPVAAVVDPSGKYLYVSNSQDALGSISAYSINSSTGALTAVAGSPFATVVNGGPIGVAVSPNGQFLYAALAGSTGTGNQIAAMTINSGTGSLAAIAGSPFTTGNEPGLIAIDPSGKFLYSPNIADNTVSAFSIDSSGGLTQISGSPFMAGSSPFAIAVNSKSATAYVANGNATTVSAYTIDSSGALTTVAPINASGGVEGVAIVAATQ
jgi:DNA-binding beta-propeller fold protein YncE